MNQKTSTPTFALVGQPNQGKTTLVSTLAENDKLKVTPIPGETKSAKAERFEIAGEAVAVFWDTPGFENTDKVHEWFVQFEQERKPGDLKHPASEFINAFQDDPKFRPECEIFRPLAEGAAIVYVVDASLRVYEPDRMQIDILKWCRNPRMAVIYSKDGKFAHGAAWRDLLHKEFNIIREFNAHAATYHDRREFFEVFRGIRQEWQKPMVGVIEALDKDRKRREAECGRLICDLLKSVMRTEVGVPFRHEDDKEKSGKRAEQKLEHKIRKLEKQFRKDVRKLFRHSKEYWKVDKLLELDLLSKEVKTILGLTKEQLALAGAITGTIIGAGIDMMVGGFSFGIGAATGFVVGGTAAYFSSDQLALVEYPKIRTPVGEIDGGQLGSAKVTARTNPTSETIYVLLDRCLLYSQKAASWSHGRREMESGKLSEESESRHNDHLTKHWEKSERDELATYIGCLAKEDPTQKDFKAADEAFIKTLNRKLDRLFS